MSDLTDANSDPRHGGEAISAVIFRLMRKLGLQEKFYGWQVVNDWAEIVGPATANQSRASRFENGTLFVTVPKDTWREELSMQVDQILKMIRSRPYGGVIKRIRFEHYEKGKKL